MASDSGRDSEVRPSIERDLHDDIDAHDDDRHEDLGDGGSVLSDRSHDDHDYSEEEYLQPEYESDLPHGTATSPDDVGDNSSHHGATDEDVFSEKSPRSSMGSFESRPDSRKARRETDNMTNMHRPPRVSDISQYDKEEFAPAARGTPRPPFRTPSDVRGVHVSSPTPSVLGSPRSNNKKHFPTVSRLGTPNTSAQYSPKRMSTPPRFKGRKEAPLVLLHVTLLPLRWVWADLLNHVETEEMSERAKTLRESWRILQDRIGDTVIERGILLGHPQNDYEILEERLLEALELPLRRRARILECGHYLGPSNEMSLADDAESEDEYGSSDHPRSDEQRHWCGTCKNEIRYDSLGPGKVFRVKVYASNGLMKAGAWAACWKEMERVDVELEPIVEPDVQEELVRLAATRQERDFAHREEAEIAKEVAEQLKEQHRKEEEDLLRAHSRTPARSEAEFGRSSSSAEERRRRDEERLREVYGETPPPQKSASRDPSSHPGPESYRRSPSPPSRPSAPEERYGRKGQAQNYGYRNASFPELLQRSVRVLMQDPKNVVIFVLGVFVLVLAVRHAPGPSEPVYEPVIHRMRDGPIIRRATIVETSQARVTTSVPFLAEPSASPDYHESPEAASWQHISVDDDPLEASQEPPKAEESETAAPSYEEEPSDEVTEEPATSSAAPEVPKPAVEFVVEETPAAPSYEAPSEALSQPTPAPEAATATAGVSTFYEPCYISAAIQGRFHEGVAQLEETEILTEKKVVRVVHTVTETEVETSTIRVTTTTAAEAEAAITTQPEPSIAAVKEELSPEEALPVVKVEPESELKSEIEVNSEPELELESEIKVNLESESKSELELEAGEPLAAEAAAEEVAAEY
ncbi:hypothetical protein GGS23DRAFT_581403 [Durotheca rogersii]|uniref:uncharacterized protein n=1 Tax=Durotheca rogersii TaxID=419775 RepID=UPI002220A53F|nr:uncharacterized protein GGS23DRAFT_581403 [Durotheca rogersii]KAI5860435.1 hypothetical protein GGS23DRAFT_581403 [Durotheca rogersii]